MVFEQNCYTTYSMKMVYEYIMMHTLPFPIKCIIIGV